MEARTKTNLNRYILRMGTNKLGIWIKGITGHNNLAYFQSKLNNKIDPTGRLCLNANETLHHLMTDCEATAMIQLNTLKNKIPLPDMTWSVKEIHTFMEHPIIHSLMTYVTQYNNRAVSYTHLTLPTTPYV